MNKKEKDALFQALYPILEKVFGQHCVAMLRIHHDRIEFRPITDCSLTIKDIQHLADELGTDAINFWFGYSGEQGYSELTPGSDGEPGKLEVMFPIPAVKV